MIGIPFGLSTGVYEVRACAVGVNQEFIDNVFIVSREYVINRNYKEKIVTCTVYAH